MKLHTRKNYPKKIRGVENFEEVINAFRGLDVRCTDSLLQKNGLLYPNLRIIVCCRITTAARHFLKGI